MKQWLSWLDATRGALWYVTLVVIVPMLVLMGAGLLYLWQHDYLLVSMAVWLGITLVAYVALVNWPQRRWQAGAADTPADGRPDTDAARGRRGLRQDDFDQLPDQLKARSDWSAQDRRIWQDACASVEATLEDRPGWNEMTGLALQQLSLIAAAYHGDKAHATYRFTLPEALLVVSIASARYRRLIQTNVPYADRVKIGTMVSLVNQQDTIRTGFTWFNRVRRTVRLVNPIGAVIGEIRDHITDRVLSQVGGAVQLTLKRLLLQEICQVGIDLYSGRLRVSEEELHDYRSAAARADEERQPEAVEALRVLIIGQTSAGKSSLVNALTDSLAAETDRLPTTDQSRAHRLSLAGDHLLHLIDTPGLEMDEARIDELADSALDADIILLLARATQPARAADVALLAAIDERFAAKPARRRPPVMLVLTHVDNLPPRKAWSPPYSLDDPEAATPRAGDDHQRKAATIRAALISVRDQLQLPPDTLSIPVCLQASRGLYNIDALGTRLMALSEAATQTQFNRRRLERSAQSIDWSARWQQMSRLGRVIGKAVIRR